MDYKLSKIEVKVIRSSLKAHLNQCDKFIELDNKTGSFTDEERHRVTAKAIIIEELLENTFKE